MRTFVSLFMKNDLLLFLFLLLMKRETETTR